MRKGTYYQLTFEIFLKNNDSCYVATTVPYSFSELYSFLDNIPSNVQVSSLGKSLSGVSIPLLTITNYQIASNNKKYIIIQARQHPSETVSSILIEKFISLLGSSENSNYSRLLDHFIFKIIPMVNVDGVVIGNSRMSFAGDDLNRKFAEPDKMLHPEILCIKKLVNDCHNDLGVFMFIDMHGHSKKKGSFMYGPYFPLHSNNYVNIRLLPKILASKSPIFRYYSCRFKSERALRQSARLVMSQNIGINYTYTMENSLYGYIDAERNSHAFSSKDFKDLAKKLIESIFSFFKYIKKQEKKCSKNKSKEDNAFSDIFEDEKENSTESDSQSESEEECLEAKKNVVKAIKTFKKNSIRDGSTIKTKSKSSKRISSHNHLSVLSKNLPNLNKKQMITTKATSVERIVDKTGYHSSINVVNNSIVNSLGDTLNREDDSISPIAEDDGNNTSISKIKIQSQRSKYSKINLFEMFSKRNNGDSVENSQYKFRKNFNFPAFFAKPLKNS